MGYEPSFSPWGVVQTCKTICPGVFEVTTPSHGGIMAKKQAASQIFSKSAQKIGFWERGCLCFEEDCDACVALRELMDRGELEYVQNGNRRLIADAAIWDWYSRAKHPAKPPAEAGD